MTDGEHGALSARLKSLTPAQRALLERQLIEKSMQAAATQTIPKRALESPIPLSYSQELLWLLDQLAPGVGAYNSTSTFRLQGPLDEEALAEAIRGTAQRHEALRTRFELVDGRPVQIVSARPLSELQIVDLSDLPEEERERRL